MSSSRLLPTGIPLFTRPQVRWPEPELSTERYRGIKKGKYHYWDARGPARDAFEQIKEQIKDHLNRAGIPVPSSSFILFDMFMIGKTQATARPYIMFSCKHRESRKAAVAVIEESRILDRCPPGIAIGDWDYPPHLKNLRQLASSAVNSDAVTGTVQVEEAQNGSHNCSLYPVVDLKSGKTRVLRLATRNMSANNGHPRMATIGSIIELHGKRFYLVPAHIFNSERHDPQGTMSKEIDDVSEDSECDLGDTDSDGENSSDAHEEVDFMSQYSASPETIDMEEDWDVDDASTISDRESIQVFDERNEQPRSITTVSNRASPSVEDVRLSSLGHLAFSTARPPELSSGSLDYCLIEIENSEKFSTNLPVLSKDTIGRLDHRAVDVTAITGSGIVLKGVLSSQSSCIRLPNAKKYIDVLFVQFEGSLQPGDCGSIVQDASTGEMYGHIVAGDAESQSAFIVPAADVLDDVMANLLESETVSAGQRFLPPSASQLPDVFGHSDQRDFINNERPAGDFWPSQPLLPQSQPSQSQELAEIGKPLNAHFPDSLLAGIASAPGANSQGAFPSSPVLVPRASPPKLDPELDSNGGLSQEVDTTVDLNSFRNDLRCELAQNPSPERVSQLLGYLDGLRNEVNERASVFQGEPMPPTEQPAKKGLDKTKRYYRCRERGCGTEVQLKNTFKRHLEDMHYPKVEYYCYHEGCRTKPPFHRRDKIAGHHRRTHGAPREGVPWEEIYQRMVPKACPPVCAVCGLNVPDWTSFYDCYADHCEIVPAPGSSRQGNHGPGNKRRRPDSDDSDDDDGADNGGPASPKKGSRRPGNVARQSQPSNRRRIGASQPFLQQRSADINDGRTLAAQDQRVNAVHPIASILQPSEPGSSQQGRISQEPRRPQLDPRPSRGQDAPRPSVRQCRYCNHIINSCLECRKSPSSTPRCHNCTYVGQATRLTSAQSNTQTPFGARIGPVIAPPVRNFPGQIAQRHQQPNQLSTQQVHAQGARSNTQQDPFGANNSYMINVVHDVLVHGLSELEIESSSVGSKSKLDFTAQGSSVWSVAVPFRGSPSTSKPVMSTTTTPADGSLTTTDMEIVTQQFIGPPTLSKVNPSSGCQCACRIRSQESYFARSRVDIAPGRRIEVDFKMAPEARDMSHLLRTRVQVVVRMLRLRSSAARSANGKHKTEARAAMKEALEASLNGTETKTMTDHDQLKVVDLDNIEYDSDVESVTDTILSANSRASSCTVLTQFSPQSSPPRWDGSKTSFCSDLELPPSAKSCSPFCFDWDVDTLCSEEQPAYDIELFEEEKELELTFDLDLHSSLDRLARCTGVPTEDFCCDHTPELLVWDSGLGL